ncbi:MAG: CPBP family intramembrane glutamic endopeptidase [Candidatus Merdivicinus sp.]|jgi:membrane protease YdiL (CAAX protease family)
MRKAGAILRILGIYLVFLFLPTGIWMAVSLLIPNKAEAVLSFLSNFATLLTAILLLALYCLREIPLKESIGWDPPTAGFSPHIAAFVLGIFGNHAVSFIMNFLPESWLTSYAEQSASVFDPNQSLVSILAIVLAAPVGEELIFRGMIFRSARRAFPLGWAAALSAILFGAAHLHPLWICYAFAMGFCFAIMVDRRASVSVSIAAHIGFNLASLPSFLLTESSLWNQLLYGTIERYLAFGVGSILVCIWIWYRFFSRRFQ